eukprot:TRINITY_DN62262_c0_g1_i1.p1 TRINITY_DN62262_c0_g1~~TRINITY_DN62262_c0_g1_i1.p1  ORF type:complete len:497 (+),score=51.77 TRINITY_DN62262_c0_g1_i1:44-1492(+)
MLAERRAHAPTAIPWLIACSALVEVHGVQQALIFDAGSSGTRVYVFDTRPLSIGDVAPHIDLATSNKQVLKLSPGLSHFAKHGDLVGVARNIQQLLDYASRFVAPPRRSSTPIMLKATAGLRSVSEEAATATLNQVRKTFATSGFLFHRSWVSIITGAEEAGLSWVAANYLRNSFVARSKSNPPTPTVGIVEMGGGSTQIAYQVDKFGDTPATDRFEFATLDGQQYKLYAHSYLNYGQDYAQSNLQKLLEASEGDPCYPVGYLRTGVHGTGSAEECVSVIKKKLLSPEKHADAPGAYVAERALHGHFVGNENFFYVRDELSLPMNGDETSMRAAAVGTCDHTLNADVNGVKALENPLKPRGCFALSYQLAFLQSLHVFEDPSFEINFAHKINGGEVGWPLGAAVVHVMAVAAKGIHEKEEKIDGVGWSQIQYPEFFGVQMGAMYVGGSIFILMFLLRAVTYRQVGKCFAGKRSVYMSADHMA